MELWIDGWMNYLLEIWHNATITDYLTLLLCVVVVGGMSNIRRSSLR